MPQDLYKAKKKKKRLCTQGLAVKVKYTRGKKM